MQGFLAKGQPDTGKHLYLVDESSLASTNQMREFLNRIGPQDRVLLIGDIRQHQGMDAGKPFEQMQAAGMQTSLLDQIVRQKDPGAAAGRRAPFQKRDQSWNRPSPAARPHHGDCRPGPAHPNHRQRLCTRPEGTLVVSPDNKSRQEINQAIRAELQTSGVVAKDSQTFQVLVQRSELTGADRKWAAQYRPGDVLQYAKGSKGQGIQANSYATVVKANAAENLLTVRKQDGAQLTYDPKRLSGISAYREVQREFAVGDRIQFTGIDRTLGVANRDLATVTKIEGIQIGVKTTATRAASSPSMLPGCGTSTTATPPRRTAPRDLPLTA